MKTKLFTLVLLVAATSFAYAQDARVILDKASDAYDKAGGITATFTLDTKDSKSRNTYSYDGKAYMKGNKFKLEIPGGITWFDGSTQWVYIKDTEEVNISNPTGDELQSISPSAIFNMYKNGFNLAYKGEKNLRGATIVEVEMTPQKKNPDISKIMVQINKTTNIFSSITIVDKSGLQNILTISKIQTGINLPDSTFSFSKKEYPGVDIIDLR